MRKYYFTIISILVLLFSSVAFATTYNVTSNATMATANSSAVAGDSVTVQAGSYSTGIAPANSGTSGNPITYTAVGNVYLTSGTIVNLNSRNYITVDGFKTSGQVTQYVAMASSDYNIIQNCSFIHGTTDWNGIDLTGDSHHNQILNNTFDAGAGGPSDQIGVWNTSHHNLIQGNTIHEARHAGINVNSQGAGANYNVVKDNIIDNTCHTGIDAYFGNEYILVEGNLIYDIGINDATVPPCNSTITSQHDIGIQVGSVYVIVRKNIMSNARPTSNVGRGALFNKDSTTGRYCDYVRFYNNTLYNNTYAGTYWDNSGADQIDNISKNNIFYLNSNLYTGNAYVDWTVSNNTDNSTNPLFTDASGEDFSLTATSPFIDSGTYLTQVNDADGCTSATEVCTSLPLDDALYFAAPSTQWGVPNTTDDYIWCTGWATPIQVIARTGDTLTLATEPNPGWSNNDNCYLAESDTVGYYGNAPAQGAYDYTTGSDESAPTPNPATWSTEPTADSVSAISMIATTGSDANTISTQFTYDPASNDCGASADIGTGGTSQTWTEADYNYTDSGLQTNQLYCYNVQLRDSIPNTGTASSTVSVYTHADTPNPPTLTNSAVDTDSQILLQAITADNNPDVNPTTQYALYVVGSSAPDVDWNEKYIAIDGTQSAVAVWQSKASWANTEIVGLEKDTTYNIQAIAKNEDGILTAFSTYASYTTTGDYVPPPAVTTIGTVMEGVSLE